MPRHRITAPLFLSVLTLAAVGCETEGYDDVLEVLEPDAAQNQAPEPELAAPESDDQTVSGAPREGRLSFPAWTSDASVCQTLTLANPFGAALESIRIQVAIDHAGSSQNYRDATTVWVEDVAQDGARICVRELAKFSTAGFEDHVGHQAGLNVAYRMYRAADIENHANAGVTGRTSGNTTPDADSNFCTAISFGPGASFSDADDIQISATITHDTDQVRDAASVWIEDLTTTGFTACMRETAHADNITNHHYAYEIDWLAYERGAEPFAGEGDRTSLDPGQRCRTVSFADSYVNPPLVFATLDRLPASSNSNAGTVWIEDLDASGFEVCAVGLSDLVDPSSFLGIDKANMDIHWLAKSLD